MTAAAPVPTTKVEPLVKSELLITSLIFATSSEPSRSFGLATAVTLKVRVDSETLGWSTVKVTSGACATGETVKESGILSILFWLAVPSCEIAETVKPKLPLA